MRKPAIRKPAIRKPFPNLTFSPTKYQLLNVVNGHILSDSGWAYVPFYADTIQKNR